MNPIAWFRKLVAREVEAALHEWSDIEEHILASITRERNKAIADIQAAKNAVVRAKKRL